ncbi:hypothetical protein CYMTET_15545 [Cymbomonas tetramitiformis]|uniref:Protein kinase domain-containing protein n=1 Tax=Cymbomonas tetramitiformis TaxID=36881 RepID=A0AAE0GDU7_9CHLO|nr:hypothetical protein CYMTET_15545 [Cymbomonas tetramitiformis]
MKVMVEALRSPDAAEDRRELLKLKNKRDATPVTKYDGELERERVRRVLARVGLSRNEKKGQWEPGQLIEHPGLEVDLREGLFRVTETRVNKIHAHARSIICDASREKRWLSARRLAAFNGLCQSVYIAAPAARMYLRELYFELTTKRSWGAKIWRSPTRAKLHTDSSLRVWGGVLNLNKEARGFWPDEHLHITHLELQAVFKTVQSFMRELEGKVVRLYCDNQAVVAMLSHFTARNPELMRRMRKLWLLLDLHDIELQARYIRSEANEWADRLSSLAYDWRGETNWVYPPWGLLDEVAQKIKEENMAATVLTPYCPGQSWFRELEQLADEVLYDDDGFANIVYGDGDKEVVDLAEEKLSVICDVENAIGEDTFFGERSAVLTDRVGTSDPPAGTRDKKIKKPSFLEQAFCLRWRTELGDSEHSELADQREWLPATTPTAPLYLASLLDSGGIKSSSLQPYLSAINNYHEDLGYEAPAKGRSVTRAVKAMAVLQADREVDSGDILTERTYLPAQHVWAAQQAAAALTPRTSEELRQLRAYVYTVFAYIMFGRPDIGVAMQRGHINSTEDMLSVVPLKEKGRRHHQVKRRLQIPWRGKGTWSWALVIERYEMDLFQFVEDKKPAVALIRIMLQICQCLTHLHARGLAHCDLKPENVLIDENGHAKVRFHESY